MLPSWIVSFADLQQLLLVFFILLFSMSSVDTAKFQAAMSSVQSGLEGTGVSFFDGGEGLVDNKSTKEKSDATKVMSIAAKKDAQLNEEHKKTEDYLKNTTIDGKKLSDVVSTLKTDEGIVLRIDDVLLFDSGSAEIKKNSEKLISLLSEYIKTFNGDIRIEGHTDNVPIKSKRYSDNWELSTSRASSVMAIILKSTIIEPSRISISGYGEHRPVAPNDTAQNKAKNRRVDIVLLSDFSKIEKGD